MLSVTAGRLDSAKVAAAEARLAPWREHFGACIRAKLAGLPEPGFVRVPYDGERGDRELVHGYRSQFYPPGYDAGAEVMQKLDRIHERLKAAQELGFSPQAGEQND